VRLIGIAILLSILVGCGTTTPIVEVQTVKVPIYMCPTNHSEINRPERPVLMIEFLTPEDMKDPGKVVKAYKAAIKQLQGYAVSLEIGFDSYRNMCLKASEGNAGLDTD